MTQINYGNPAEPLVKILICVFWP